MTKIEKEIQKYVLQILNEPGMTWKVRRALLLSKGIPKTVVDILMPPPPEGLDWHPSDY